VSDGAGARERRERRVSRLATLGTLFLRALASTWRVRFTNAELRAALDDRRQPFIYVLWHGELLPLLWAHRGRGVAIMISEHSDGEIIARIAHALGYRTVRGSTSRGAARALLGACREIERGVTLAVTPDGPRGPAHTVAPGAAIIAQRTNAPMLPVSARPSSAWHLTSWDRFMIPRPFATITVGYGDPIFIQADSARDAATDTQLVSGGIASATERAAAGA
jgi:lysophospholipid acyltransferase (LPLAT)-like uncharacterized protein